jgi:hypothetical protein
MLRALQSRGGAENDPFAEVALPDLAGVAVADLPGAAPDGSLPAAVREHLRAQPLDVLVWLGSERPAGDCAGCARLGVWSFRFGDAERPLVRPYYWREIADQDEVSLVALERHDASFDEARTIVEDATTTQVGWYAGRNATQATALAAPMIVHALLDAARDEPRFVQRAGGARPAPPRARPASPARAARFVADRIAHSVRARVVGNEASGQEYWIVALRRRTGRDGQRVAGNDYVRVPMPEGAQYADPFLCERDGRHWLFVEEIPAVGVRAHLTCLEVRDDLTVGEPVVVMKRPYHLSYPCVFTHEGEHFMIPESGESGTVQLHRATRFPHEWELDTVLFEGLPLRDTTPVLHDGTWYFFTTVHEEAPETFLFTADSLRGPWRYHPGEPSVLGRPARTRRRSRVRARRHAHPAGAGLRRPLRLRDGAQRDRAPDAHRVRRTADRDDPARVADGHPRHAHRQPERHVRGHRRQRACGGARMTSPTNFRQSTPQDRPAIVALLKQAFAIADGAPDAFIRDDQLHWKYWQPHPAWDGARSYVLERAGSIVAHGAVWPLTILTPHGEISAIQLYDWAADPKAVGAGFSILKGASKLADVICSIGGTETTQRMRAPMGFQPRNMVHTFVRVVRPVGDALAQPRSWRTPLRALRSTMRNWPLPSPEPGWSAAEIAPDRLGELDLPYPAPGDGRYVFEQSAARLQFLATCPTVRFRFYAVRRHDAVAGYFVMRYDDGPVEARIIDAWVGVPDPAAWSSLFALAVRATHHDSAAVSVRTFASVDGVRLGLERCGFQSTYEQPVELLDPAKRAHPDAELLLQLVHTDYAFL